MVDVRCFAPGHDHDRAPSCGVNLDHGGFRCQACGAKGGPYDVADLLGKSPRDAADLCKRHGLGECKDAQPLDVEALARGAHMSAGHLSREFRLA
jgi:AraC-like DNA-binding protein